MLDSGKTFGVRISSPEDICRLKQIWKMCFGDDDGYIDFYFDNYYKPENVMVLQDGGTVASMTVGFPTRLVLPDGVSIPVLYLYAFATDPEYRGKYYGKKLMEFVELQLLSRGFAGSAVVPGNAGLFSYYSDMGFKEAFYVDESHINSSLLNFQAHVNEGVLKIFKTTPHEYNSIREDILSGKAHILYDDEILEYQKSLSQASDCDIYKFSADEVTGCAAAEKTDSNTLLLKELLIPEKYVEEVLSLISGCFTVEKVIIRRPVYSTGSISKSVRPFGMLKLIDTKYADEVRAANIMGYLAFAFD